jgi:hypothetical protein
MDDYQDEDPAAGQNTQLKRVAIGIAFVIVVAGGLWWYLRRPEAPPAVVEQPAQTAPPAADDPAPPAIKHPLEVAPEAPPAAGAQPANPDAAVQGALDEVFGAGSLAQWLIPEQLARRVVATTDNLGRNVRTEALRPLRAPTAPFVVEREVLDASDGSERITLASGNAARYDAPVALLARVDAAQAARVYKRIYPQLQRAWEDLGYPDRYFNDRVVEVIDQLLATPEPNWPLLLEQPKVLYRFADAELESRSAGQKLLLRMGVEHTRTVKQKLREFRAQITKNEQADERRE